MIPFIAWVAIWAAGFCASVLLAVVMIAKAGGGSVLITVNDYGEVWVDMLVLILVFAIMCVGFYQVVKK